MPACSRCHEQHNRKDARYCASCHAAYMREWRKDNPLTGGAKDRDQARHVAGVYKRRGALRQMPCVACGSPESQMHHPDHERPLEVTWLCRPCHLAWHAFWRLASQFVFQRWMAERTAELSNASQETIREVA